jgi:hypothetical protein
MKRIALPILLLVVASSAFPLGTRTVGMWHAENGLTYTGVEGAVIVSQVDDGRLWLNGTQSYQLLFSERDKLLNLVGAAARKIDIATANKTTISFAMDLGGFYSDDGALFNVSFQTSGYESSRVVVSIMENGNYDILLLNKKNAQELLDVLGDARGLIDDYQRQAALFK